MPLRLSKISRLKMGADGLLLILLAGSLGLNVYLGIDRARATQPMRPIETSQILKTNAPAPPFAGLDAKGTPVSLRFSDDTRDTMLYVFSPTCHWCQKNVANIKAIIKARPDLRVVGVSLGDTTEDAQAREIAFASVVRPTQATIVAYGLRATPTTILVSREGKVIKTWSGAYTGPTGADVAKVVAVSLPGLID